jgi:flagellar basal-body rod modification protein FlgD
MPTTPAIDSSASLYANQLAQSERKASAARTKDEFLTMLVTQMRNQDPLNPMDNAAITQQMAQLSTVEGINELNDTLLSISSQVDFSQAMSAASLVGKHVLVPGEKIKLGDGVTTPFGVDLMSPADQVTTVIKDGAGKVIRTVEHGPLEAGVHSYSWDGLDDKGAAVPNGAYFIETTATVADSPVAAQSLMYGQVGSVAYTANGLRLDLGLTGNVALTDLRKVM